MFSFNNPFGACESCDGLGYLMEIDPDLLVPDPSLSLSDGAIVPWNGATTMGSWNHQMMISVCEHFSIPLDKPFKSLADRHKNILLNGAGDEKILTKWQNRTGEGFGQFTKYFEGRGSEPAPPIQRIHLRGHQALDRERTCLSAHAPPAKAPGLEEGEPRRS